MTELGAVLASLKKERAQLDKAITVLSGLARRNSVAPTTRRAKRRLSVAARKRIAAAQRARWARAKAKKAA